MKTLHCLWSYDFVLTRVGVIGNLSISFHKESIIRVPFLKKLYPECRMKKRMYLVHHNRFRNLRFCFTPQIKYWSAHTFGISSMRNLYAL